MRDVRHILGWLGIWVVTRAFALVQVGFWNGTTGPVFQDVDFFEAAADHLATVGAVPDWDSWQYPPGAAFLLVLPRSFTTHYAEAFIALMLLADAAALVALAVLARREGRTHGVWLWLLGMPLLSVFPLLRFDVVPTAIAVWALVLVPGNAVLVGVIVGLGAMIKVWPLAVLLAEWDRRRVVAALAGFAGVSLLLLAVAAAAFGDQTPFLTNQGGRGLQAEAVAGTPWHIRAVVTGQAMEYVGRYGAQEVVGTVADRVADGLGWATLAAGLGVALWWLARDRAIRRRGRLDLTNPAVGRDAVFAAVLLAVVVSRVLSPQFMIWLLGLTAVVLASRDSRLRRPAWIVTVAIGLTAAIYADRAYLVLRNVILLVAAVDAAVVMVRAVRGPGDVSQEAEVGTPVSPRSGA